MGSPLAGTDCDRDRRLSGARVDAFPFTKIEWDRVTEASRALVNATLADDAVLQASLFAELQAVLEELRAGHGDHPVLLETEADFHDDPHSQRDMYLSAIRLAEAHALPTYTIRLSLARVLLENFDDPARATNELRACERELPQHADQGEMGDWSKLIRECEGRLAGRRFFPPKK